MGSSEEDAEAMQAAQQEKKRQKDLKDRERFMEKFSADELFGVEQSVMHRRGEGRGEDLREMTFSKALSRGKDVSDDEYDIMGRVRRVTDVMLTRMLIAPGSHFRLYWDIASITLVIFLAAVLPYRICFVLEWNFGFAITDFLIDLFFLMDIVLNFFTCYIDREGEIIGSYYLIARHYSRSWLLPDLISSIPFDWLVFGFNFTPPSLQNSRYSRYVDALRLFRLLRVARLYRYVNRWEEHFAFFSSNVLRLLYVLALVIFFAHWNGCVQYLLATFEAEWVYDPVGNNRTLIFHPDSWVARLQAENTLDERNAWAWSFFIAFAQILCSSTGLKDPKREVELWGYLFSLTMGSGLYGFFIASLTTAISEADASAKDYRTKLDMVNQYMRHSQLPLPLRMKLRTYFELRFPSKRSFDEVGILSEISSSLRQEVTLHKCRGVLSLLQVVDSTTTGRTLAGALSQQLERVVYVAGDTIIRHGDEAEAMYFVSSGSVEVVSPTGETLAVLGASSFFGEMALLNPDGRSLASVIVKSYCEGYCLSRNAYGRLVHSYPAFKDLIESVAKLRLKHSQLATKGGPKGIGPKGKGTDTDLASMFENLNPTKRKLVTQEKLAARRASIQPRRRGSTLPDGSCHGANRDGSVRGGCRDGSVRGGCGAERDASVQKGTKASKKMSCFGGRLPCKAMPTSPLGTTDEERRMRMEARAAKAAIASSRNERNSRQESRMQQWGCQDVFGSPAGARASAQAGYAALGPMEA